MRKVRRCYRLRSAGFARRSVILAEAHNTLDIAIRGDDRVQLLLRRQPTAAQTPSDTPDTPSPDGPTPGGLDRVALVRSIMTLNPTASEEYLGSFNDRSLAMYLAHLESAGSPRGARWERPCDSPAIVGRESAE